MTTIIPFRIKDDSVMVAELSDGRLIAQSLVKPELKGDKKHAPITISIQLGEEESETITTHKFIGSLRPIQVFFARAKHLERLFRPEVWVAKEEKERRKAMSQEEKLRKKQLYSQGKATWRFLSKEEKRQYKRGFKCRPRCWLGGSSDEKPQAEREGREDKRRREWQAWTAEMQSSMQGLKNEMRREQHEWKQELSEEVLKVLEAAVEDHEGVAAGWKGMVEKDWETMAQDVNRMVDCEGQKWWRRLDDMFGRQEEAWRREWERRWEALDREWSKMIEERFEERFEEQFEERFEAAAEEWRQRMQVCFGERERVWAREAEEKK
ncbi:hypothetical protein CDD82_7928 [Ophiocordyceps australis]|uniref:Uncharacterized protein n=1 Tax=Ophiocordyceps australis TaxID=1399860 RepID=A0A2C5YUH7_9HYPO|nr:hypothetical protein CDD82_7928 [Ophiocordyceps australis]